MTWNSIHTKRISAVVALTCILLLGVLTLSTGVASAEDSNLSEQITPEELFELLSSNWCFNAIKEGDKEPTYYELLPNGYGSTYEMDGLPELGIIENVTCEERETFVDDNNTVKTGTAKNRTDIVVAK